MEKRLRVRLVVAGSSALVAALLASACSGAAAGGKAGSGGAAAAGTTIPATTAATTTSTPATTTTAAVTTAPTTTAPTTTVAPTPAPPAPCAVSYVGDSLGMGTLRNGLPQALAGVGCPLVWYGGYGGMETSAGARLLAQNQAKPTNVALVMLGYHNARSEVSRGMFPGLIDQVMKGAGDRLVVWPLLGSTSDCSAGYKVALVRANKELQEATARWPNLVLADYPSFTAPHPEYSENRCPHLLPPGYRAAASWLAGEVRRLVDARAAATPAG